jgi:phospholipid/cholesterol/gamma-HCH transport system substrate-binding protein
MRRFGQRRRTAEGEERRYLTAAALAVVLIVVVTYFAFAKQLPFQHPYQIRGVFSGIAQLKPGSDVRISGVSVGSVSGIAAGPGHTSIVTMKVDRRVPIHRDATLAITPRLALEGNDYVNVSVGTPGTAVLRSGATIPVARTSHEVQLNELIDVLNVPTRKALTSTIRSLAQGFGDGGSGRLRPGVETGYTALRGAARQLSSALGSITEVTDAAQGTQPGDLAGAVRSTGAFTAQLAANPAALAGIVTDFDRFTGALAAEDRSLAASVRGFDDLTRSAPPNLAAIDRALPVLTSFAHALGPALHVAPANLADFGGLLGQLAQLGQPGSLPALLTRLAPVTSNLPPLERQLTRLFGLLAPVSTCISRNVVPTLDTVLKDGVNSSGRPVWQDLLHLVVNLAGAAADFDGNGTTIRLGLSEGEHALTGVIPGIGKVVGLGPTIEGVRPVWLGYGVNPPFRPDQTCDQQPLPDLAADGAGAPTDVKYSSVPALSSADSALASAMLQPAGPERNALLTRQIARLMGGGGGTTRSTLAAAPAGIPARRPARATHDGSGT